MLATAAHREQTEARREQDHRGDHVGRAVGAGRGEVAAGRPSGVRARGCVATTGCRGDGERGGDLGAVGADHSERVRAGRGVRGDRQRALERAVRAGGRRAQLHRVGPQLEPQLSALREAASGHRDGAAGLHGCRAELDLRRDLGLRRRDAVFGDPLLTGIRLGHGERVVDGAEGKVGRGTRLLLGEVGAVDQLVLRHVDHLIGRDALAAQHLGGAVVGPDVLLGRLQVVVLRTRVRHDVDRAGGESRGLGRIGVHVAAGVRVVVAHEHQVDVVALEDRQPLGAQHRLVTTLGCREHRLVERDDIPLRRAVLQQQVEPGALEAGPEHADLRGGALRAGAGGEAGGGEEGGVAGRVQRDEPHALVVGVVRGLRGERAPVVEERAVLLCDRGVALRELGQLAHRARRRVVVRVLERGLPCRQQLVARVLVVAGGGHHVGADGRVLHALEPVDPLVLVARRVDQVACVHRADGARRLGLGLLHDARPRGVEADLRVAVVDELEVRGRRIGGAEGEPVAPAAGEADTVAVLGRGGESGHGGREVLVRVAVHHTRVIGVDRAGIAAGGRSDLDLSDRVRGVAGEPGERLRDGGLLGRCEDHPGRRRDDGGAGSGCFDEGQRRHVEEDVGAGLAVLEQRHGDGVRAVVQQVAFCAERAGERAAVAVAGILDVHRVGDASVDVAGDLGAVDPDDDRVVVRDGALQSRDLLGDAGFQLERRAEEVGGNGGGGRTVEVVVQQRLRRLRAHRRELSALGAERARCRLPCTVVVGGQGPIAQSRGSGRRVGAVVEVVPGRVAGDQRSRRHLGVGSSEGRGGDDGAAEQGEQRDGGQSATPPPHRRGGGGHVSPSGWGFPCAVARCPSTPSKTDDRGLAFGRPGGERASRDRAHPPRYAGTHAQHG